MEGRVMTAILLGSFFFVGNILLSKLIEELAETSITKLKNSNTVKHQILVFWFCFVFYFETRSRKNHRFK